MRFESIKALAERSLKNKTKVKVVINDIGVETGIVTKIDEKSKEITIETQDTEWVLTSFSIIAIGSRLSKR